MRISRTLTFSFFWTDFQNVIHPFWIGVEDGLGHDVEIFERGLFGFGVVGGGEGGRGDEYGRDEYGVRVALRGAGDDSPWGEYKAGAAVWHVRTGRQRRKGTTDDADGR